MKHSKGFLKLVDAAKKRIPEITVREVIAGLKQKRPIVLVDVREDHEWEAGHASGAIHLGKGIIERDIEKAVPDKKQTVVLYCGGGYRSALAADNLSKMGYRNVFSMAGGWRAWKRNRGTTEK